MDRMNTRSQGRKNKQNRPYNAYIHRGKDRGCKNYAIYDRGKGIYRQGFQDRDRREHFSLRAKTGGYSHSRRPYRRSDSYTYRSEIRQSRFRSPFRSPTRRSRVASKSPRRDNNRFFNCT